MLVVYLPVSVVHVNKGNKQRVIHEGVSPCSLETNIQQAF